MENTSEYYSALTQCAERYSTMLWNYRDECNYWGWSQKPRREEVLTLAKFIITFNVGCIHKLPLMKMNRWLGYIQGQLISWGLTTVEDERNWTRPLFRHLDYGDEDEEI